MTTGPILLTKEMLGIKIPPGSPEFTAALSPIVQSLDALSNALEDFEKATGFRMNLAITYELTIPE